MKLNHTNKDYEVLAKYHNMPDIKIKPLDNDTKHSLLLAIFGLGLIIPFVLITALVFEPSEFDMTRVINNVNTMVEDKANCERLLTMLIVSMQSGHDRIHDAVDEKMKKIGC